MKANKNNRDCEKLSTREKARRYDEAFKRVKNYSTDHYGCILLLIGIMALKKLQSTEQNTACSETNNEVKPKFHKGDWIILQGTKNIYQVVAAINNQYQLKYGNNYTIQNCADVDKCAKLHNRVEWSEEDERMFMIIRTILHFDAFRNHKIDKNGEELDIFAEIKKWLNSVKDRIQQQTNCV